MKPIPRRTFLGSAAVLASAACPCLAKTTHDCCTIPVPPEGAVSISPGLVTISLARIPEMRRTGSFLKVVDPARNLQIIVAKPEKDRFVALSQKCTHGGGALTYVHEHKHLWCTCWGHSKFALDGSVIRWPNKNTPKPLATHEVARKGDVLEIRVEGLV
mgnify:CR=1 FL=1